MSHSKKNATLLVRFLSNTGWQLAQNVYSMVLSLVVGALSARYLGPANYGLVGYGASLVAMFSAVCKLGMDGVVINEIVKKKEKSGDYIGAILVMRIIASFVSIVAIHATVLVIEPGNTTLHTITFLQSVGILLQIHEVFNYWFQAKLMSKYYVIASVIGLTVMSIWRIALLYTGAHVEWFALSSSIQAGAVLIVTGVVFAKMFPHKLRCQMADVKHLWGIGHHFIISTLAIVLYMQTDKIMLGKMVGEEAVGYYTAAMTIATLWEFVPGAIINSARPIIMGDRENNYAGYIKKLQLLMLFMTGMGLAVGVGILLFGRIAILLMYGKSYEPAVPVLMMLIWSTTFSQLGTARGVWIIAEGKNAYQKYTVVAGAIFNIVLNSVLIRHWSMTGAAIATILAQVFVVFGTPLIFPAIRPFNNIYFTSFKLLKQLRVSDIKALVKH